SLPLASYAKTYTDAWYGKAAVEVKDGGLYLRFQGTPAMHGPLEHFRLNTFVVRWQDPNIPDAYVHFADQIDGSVAGFQMSAISDLADFSFDYGDLRFEAGKPAAKK